MVFLLVCEGLLPPLSLFALSPGVLYRTSQHRRAGHLASVGAAQTIPCETRPRIDNGEGRAIRTRILALSPLGALVLRLAQVSKQPKGPKALKESAQSDLVDCES